MQREDDLAALHALAGIVDRLPRPAIPHDHLAGAVLLRGNRALEAAVSHRMVFDVDRHPLGRRIQARPLRYGPAQQHAVEFQAKVVMQTRCPVLLDHERPLLAAFCRLARGLRCLLEVALRVVAGKRRCGAHGRVRWRVPGGAMRLPSRARAFSSGVADRPAARIPVSTFAAHCAVGIADELASDRVDKGVRLGVGIGGVPPLPQVRTPV
jgi:hypothetical protein